MSSVDIREVLKLQERNMSLRQIANRLGLHHTTVSRWLQRAKELLMFPCVNYPRVFTYLNRSSTF